MLRDRKSLFALSCLILGLFGFGSIPVFLRGFADARYGLDPWTVNGTRYAVAALFWLPLTLRFARRADSYPPGGSLGSLLRAALVPAAVNTLAQILWAICPYYISAPVVAFGSKTSFLFIVLLGFLVVPEERLLARKPSFYIGVAACVVGIVLLFFFNHSSSDASGKATNLTGLALIGATALLFGAYIVSVRRCVAGYSTRLAFGVICLYTAPPLIVLFFAVGDYGRLAEVSGAVLSVLILSGLIGIAFSHVLYYQGIQRFGPIVASGVMMVTPFLTLLGAWIFLGESMSGWQFLGGLVIILGGASLLVAKAHVDSDARDLAAARQF